MSVGNRIKHRRKELHMSAEQLASKIGVSPATIYRYENGSIANMGTDKLDIIAQALSIEPKHLMGWTDCESSNSSKTTDNSTPVLSPEALKLARMYDSLDSHSQRIVYTVAMMESERDKPMQLPAGIKPIGSVPMYKIPYLGEAICDGSIETKYAARQEISELESSPDITPV